MFLNSFPRSVLSRICDNSDNGSEFSNPKGIEYDENGLSVSRVFYCDAGSSYQKGAIEVNHELIQRILSKGSSYEAFSFYYGETVLAKLGCSHVSPDEIILKPSLLK